MNIVDIIDKKRVGLELSEQEINYAVSSYVSGEVKDYQMSSLLMAICINSMTDAEMFYLTKSYVESGDVNDFSEQFGVVVDKHSTGGVGDKTTLILGPIVSACGVPFAKMSGRGLGFTGGTLDKLESIEGFKIEQSLDEFIELVQKNQIAVVGQTSNLVPADKLIYALRDVTGTVASIPLIAASIMSKKIASGADHIVIDLKVGSGAFMKTMEEAQLLANAMKIITDQYNRKLAVFITNMDEVLGMYVGNGLEVFEAKQFFDGIYTSHLYELIIELSAVLVSFGHKCSVEEAKIQVLEVLENGKAKNQFKVFVEGQGGDFTSIYTEESDAKVKNVYPLLANKSGYITSLDSLTIAKAALRLGAGRLTKESVIDMHVGIKVNYEIGDYINIGDEVLTIFDNNGADLSDLFENLVVTSETEFKTPIIYDIIGLD